MIGYDGKWQKDHTDKGIGVSFRVSNGDVKENVKNI